MASPRNVRLILIGKTGNGKSTTANAILGEDLCKPSRGMSSGTQVCSWHKVVVDDLTIEVTDTPGVCDTHRDKQDIQKEIAKCLATMSPGPDAILLVISGERRFTDEEHKAFLDLKEVFGEDLTKYLILVFTAIELEELQEFLENSEQPPPPKLIEVLKEAADRYACVSPDARNNKETRQRDAEYLLSIVHKLREDTKDFYTNSIVRKCDDILNDNAKEKGVNVDEVKQEIVAEQDKNLLKTLSETVPTQVSKNKTFCSVM
ncbi:GTPase IMAP family member 4-like [Pomacea canaliculata]|uniref:GTPase IMAP family member 4-like n=1 Tax=Pomacea canaliculata TaxID=400727 RepID=UPI000D73B024|nr:GTPase IMAP family member 4-like [Pomacea canaliculata]